MVGVHAHEVEATLLLLSEARECAERAARALASTDAEKHVIEALERVDMELLAMHRRLMDEAIFNTPGAERQLALDAA